jgi:hypothetical protein
LNGPDDDHAHLLAGQIDLLLVTPDLNPSVVSRLWPVQLRSHTLHILISKEVLDAGREVSPV